MFFVCVAFLRPGNFPLPASPPPPLPPRRLPLPQKRFVNIVSSLICPKATAIMNNAFALLLNCPFLVLFFHTLEVFYRSEAMSVGSDVGQDCFMYILIVIVIR